jgi:hypothetical protein
MGLSRTLLTVAILAGPAATQAQPQAPGEPAPLTLPMGARVRLQTGTAADPWVRGFLVSADAASVALMPEGAPPLGVSPLRLPSRSVTRLELHVGQKRHWLGGLLVGLAGGLAIGLTEEVDPVRCEYDYATSCNRTEAVIVDTLIGAGLGAGIGALFKSDRWIPVATDALAPPPPPPAGRVAPQVRAVPSGVSLGLAVGF